MFFLILKQVFMEKRNKKPGNAGVAELIMRLERSALERWYQGDPSGFLEITAPDVVYFDPVQRLEGHEQLTALYESARGLIQADSFEMIHARVQEVENMAVLTYQLLPNSGSTPEMWNCTEVYQLKPEGWRIVQTHWSKSNNV